MVCLVSRRPGAVLRRRNHKAGRSWVILNTTLITIPSKFAIFNLIKTLQFFKSTFQKQGDYWVSKILMEARFVSHLRNYGLSNYFFPIFAPQFAKVYESGMYVYWGSIRYIYYEKAGMRDLNDEIVSRNLKLNINFIPTNEIPRDIAIHFSAFVGAALFLQTSEYIYNFRSCNQITTFMEQPASLY